MALVLAATLAGTFWGEDDHFPVGPFRMYSISNKLDGEIAVITFVATTLDGERIELRPERFGLRPAEVEGRLDLLLADPDLMAGLVDAYERLDDDAPRLASLSLLEEAHQLEDGRPVSTDRRVLASWERE